MKGKKIYMYFKVPDTSVFKIVLCDKTILELDKDNWYVDEVYLDDKESAKDIKFIHLTIKRK